MDGNAHDKRPDDESNQECSDQPPPNIRQCLNLNYFLFLVCFLFAASIAIWNLTIRFLPQDGWHSPRSMLRWRLLMRPSHISIRDDFINGSVNVNGSVLDIGIKVVKQCLKVQVSILTIDIIAASDA